ncbi:MAG: LysR family transcriptional regulator [Rubrivivax sp.]|nr:LysR family transcriptional regulator [Rubrivivax sp.]
MKRPASKPPRPVARAATPRRPALADGPALMRLRTRQLLLVARLGEEHHLGRAAAAMGISQPAATRLLHEMEDVLGARLFERGARGMSPTASGEVLVRYARQVLNDFGAARRELAAFAAGLHGSLRVGSVPSAMPDLVAPVLARFKMEHPRVAVAVTVATSDVIVPLLARGEADLVLGRLGESHGDDEFDAVPLLEEPHAVVLRNGHPLLQAQPAAGVAPGASLRQARARRASRGTPDRPVSERPDLRELARWPWVVQPPGSPQHGRFVALMREAGVQRRLDITETASTVATTALLASSDMLAVMPQSLAAHYARLGVLAVLPVALPMRVPAIHLVRRRAREPSPTVAAFVERVVQHARSLGQATWQGTGPPSPGGGNLSRTSGPRGFVA